jgi:hypothetical protein
LRSWGKQELILIGIREFEEISSHVASKGGEEIFSNWGWVWGGIPHIRKFPIALFRKEEKTKRKKGKKKEMLDPTHYPA